MNELLFFLHTTNKFINNYQKIVEKNYIFYNIIAIKWGRIDPGRNDPDSYPTTWPIYHSLLTQSQGAHMLVIKFPTHVTHTVEIVS